MDWTSGKAPLGLTNDFKPFTSPVNGEVITSKNQLREHEKQNNVVQVGTDFDETIKKKQKQQQELKDE